jgi:hypothetical protein
VDTFPEIARQRAEQAAMAQDAAHKANRTAHASARVVELDTEAEDRRNWALAQVQANGIGHQIGGEPRLVYWRNPDGTDNLRVDPQRPNKTIATTVHGPPVIVSPARIWTDAEEEELRRQERENANALLAAHYPLGELVSARILTDAEAAHPDVQAAAAARAKRIADRTVPYDLEASVR